MSSDKEHQNLTMPNKVSDVEASKESADNAISAVLDSSDDESRPSFLMSKRRVKRFSDSDSELPQGNDALISGSEDNNSKEVSNIVKKGRKSRIRKVSDSDSDIEPKRPSVALDDRSNDEDPYIVQNNKSSKVHQQKVDSSDADSESDYNQKVVSKNEEQQLRMKNKKDKLRDKFKNLLNSRDKDLAVKKKSSDAESRQEYSSNEDSASSNDEESSMNIIRQKIKERSATLKMSICDPDTSDEENSQNNKVHNVSSKTKKVQKRTILTSPKPQRMSAKQAMENMQKIKSESNRMLREREVSLPYHRPKALSLQDIMKRRRPAVSSDGKALPIKMNEDQLKQYALLLEQRQKEMMELCKSESEEEEETEKKCTEESAIVDTLGNNGELSKDTAENIAHNTTELANRSTAEITSEINSIINDADQLDHVNGSTNAENKDEGVIISKELGIATNSNGLEEDLQNRSENTFTEMHLLYNDSVEEDNVTNNVVSHKVENESALNDEQLNSPVATINDVPIDNVTSKESNPHNTEIESQLISLHYDSEQTELIDGNSKVNANTVTENKDENQKNSSVGDKEIDDFPDDDDMDMDEINMEDIDTIIENAEIIKNNPEGVNSPALIRDIPVLNVKPKLTGAPGMVIDLDGTDPIAPKKLTGVELLKERFTFFSKLKTPEEMERDREKRQKPGTQHLKLKQELEDIIAEQRSLEWSKRLESEKQHQMELDAIRGDGSDAEDDIDKIEAKLNEKDVEKESSSESEEEEDLLEDDVLVEDKPKKKNLLVADEAEESDVDESGNNDNDHKEVNDDENDIDDGVEADSDNDQSDDESSEQDESSESDEERENKPKKGRILKAFEDSDDEDISYAEKEPSLKVGNEGSDVNESDKHSNKLSESQTRVVMDSQDDVIQLAQIAKQVSSDVFTSQGSALHNSQGNCITTNNSKDDDDLGTQTFSILNASKTVNIVDDPDKLTVIPDETDKFTSEDLNQLGVISETQPFSDDNLDAVVGMCSGNFQTQNCIEIEPPSMSQISQSQAIGEDLLDMCTGKFYDNQFVSPNDDKLNTSDDMSQDPSPLPEVSGLNREKLAETAPTVNVVMEEDKQQEDVLKSVLDELNEPGFGSVKPLKFFFDGKSQNKENEQNATNAQVKKKFVIDSDEETNDSNEMNHQKKKKKFKKKKLEQRALQISDDEEEEEYDEHEVDDYLSGNENVNEEEKLVEYDSEENEIEVKPQHMKKKKRKANEFFEQEAELTSEDEWVGSGDEDEAGLDRMEREEGDDETFHQGQLQRELGQIHMRDVLDQDKREVRLIQELLFEDGDLGGGGRQRKFRWRNADGEEVTGTIPEEFADTQEEEFESEEQWRKQRHERELFLRQMKNNDEEKDDLNVSVNRTSIIKANLCSRTMSSLLEEVKQTKTEAPQVAVPEKKSIKDIPSPVKKPFTMFQQNYHGSLLTRGQGALARLAALATPLAADDDAPKMGLLAPSSKRNFVFAAVTKEDVEPKVTKRKAESNVGTPRLVKKMKTEEKQNRPKSSLLEFLKT